MSTTTPLPVTLLEWRPMIKGALRGFATIRLGKSLKIVDISVLASNGLFWANLPSKPMVSREGTLVRDDKGKQRYVPILEWTDREASDRFSLAVVGAVREAHGPEALEPMA